MLIRKIRVSVGPISKEQCRINLLSKESLHRRLSLEMMVLGHMILKRAISAFIELISSKFYWKWSHYFIFNLLKFLTLLIHWTNHNLWEICSWLSHFLHLDISGFDLICPVFLYIFLKYSWESKSLPLSRCFRPLTSCTFKRSWLLLSSGVYWFADEVWPPPPGTYKSSGIWFDSYYCELLRCCN